VTPTPVRSKLTPARMDEGSDSKVMFITLQAKRGGRPIWERILRTTDTACYRGDQALFLM
jgi:hypothetical protein